MALFHRTETRHFHRAECDLCGAGSPEVESQTDLAALDILTRPSAGYGWKAVPAQDVPGQYVAYCPRCLTAAA